MKYILDALLEIERELVVGEDKDKAPATLKKVRKLSDIIAMKINRENEKEMINSTLERFKNK